MGYLNRIKNSIYSPSFYSTLPGIKGEDAFKYFLLLIIPLSLIQLIFVIPTFVSLNKEIPTFISQAMSKYPKGLEVKITNGKATSNVSEPYFIKSSEKSGFSNFLVIDTKTPYSAQQFADYDAAAWLTRDTLFLKESNQTRVVDLRNVRNVTINESTINGWVQKLSPYFPVIGVALIMFTGLGLFLLYLSKLLYLFFLAVLIWAVGKIFKWNFKYGQSYRIGIFAITLSLFIDLIVTSTSKWTHFNGFPFMFTIIALIIVVINFTQTSREKPRPV